MPVMFKTQQGRTLINDDLTADALANQTYVVMYVVGYEHGDAERRPIWVNPRMIVEWWDSWLPS